MSDEVNISLLRSLVDLFLSRFYKHFAPLERKQVLLTSGCKAANKIWEVESIINNENPNQKRPRHHGYRRLQG